MTEQEAIKYLIRPVESSTIIGDEVGKQLEAYNMAIDALERSTPQRVSVKEWKGWRDTRYTCPRCKKFAKRDETYCHKCGQRLIFPTVHWTPYVPGEKQSMFITWEDEK